MIVITTPGKFPTGEIVMTRGAAAALTCGDISEALDRHLRGDWGELDLHDWELNQAALKDGVDRLFSVYKSEAGTKFYLITEWDRSVTTFLLPEEY
jgi:hypothetical protein